MDRGRSDALVIVVDGSLFLDLLTERSQTRSTAQGRRRASLAGLITNPSQSNRPSPGTAYIHTYLHNRM